MKNPEFVRKISESGATLVPTSPAEFGKQIQQAIDRYQRVSQMANIRAD
jgi:tripartite-type tricarboxylate transporter receptor subunit TctC